MCIHQCAQWLLIHYFWVRTSQRPASILRWYYYFYIFKLYTWNGTSTPLYNLLRAALTTWTDIIPACPGINQDGYTSPHTLNTQHPDGGNIYTKIAQGSRSEGAHEHILHDCKLSCAHDVLWCGSPSRIRNDFVVWPAKGRIVVQALPGSIVFVGKPCRSSPKMLLHFVRVARAGARWCVITTRYICLYGCLSDTKHWCTYCMWMQLEDWSSLKQGHRRDFISSMLRLWK